MYRHSTHTDCARCKRSIAIDQAELDLEARYVCTPCNARNRLEAALVRWRRPRKMSERDLATVALIMFPLWLLVILFG
jgi:DNA-directed RNA polymerase subunit RPC12/RpoP